MYAPALAALSACHDTLAPVVIIPIASELPSVHVDYAIQYVAAPPPTAVALSAVGEAVYFNHVEPQECVSSSVQAGARSDTLVVTLTHFPVPAIPCPAPVGYLWVSGHVPAVSRNVHIALFTEVTRSFQGPFESRSIIATAVINPILSETKAPRP